MKRLALYLAAFVAGYLARVLLERFHLRAVEIRLDAASDELDALIAKADAAQGSMTDVLPDLRRRGAEN